MKKNYAGDLAKALPNLIKNAIDYLKTNFDTNGQKLLENTGGTVGVLLNIFAQPLIDKYFYDLAENKMSNHGFNVYLKSALLQAGRSLESIKGSLDNNRSPELIFDGLDRSISEEITEFKKDDIMMIYQ